MSVQRVLSSVVPLKSASIFHCRTVNLCWKLQVLSCPVNTLRSGMMVPKMVLVCVNTGAAQHGVPGAKGKATVSREQEMQGWQNFFILQIFHMVCIEKESQSWNIY